MKRLCAITEKMTRGNQRDIDRMRAANRHAHKGAAKDGDPVARREADAKALQEKIAKKKAASEGAAAGAGSGGGGASGGGGGGGGGELVCIDDFSPNDSALDSQAKRSSEEFQKSRTWITNMILMNICQ